MGTLGWISSGCLRTLADISNRCRKGHNRPSNPARVAEQSRPGQSADDGGQQRHTIGKIGGPADATRRDGNRDALADTDTQLVIDTIGTRTAREHPAQILAAAAPFFVATTATALFHHDFGLLSVHCPDHAAYRTTVALHGHQRRSGAVSSNGRNLSATASRARKMRERTVPIGQSMMPAISS